MFTSRHKTAQSLLLSALVAASAWPSAAPAAVPRVMTITGRLLDPSGTARDGVYSLSMSLWQHPTSIAAALRCFEESQPISVSNGSFRVILGAKSGGISGCTLSDPHWLELRVGGDAAMGPRLQFHGASYALGAELAGVTDAVRPPNSTEAITLGHAVGQIPYADGTMATGLNADLVDGKSAVCVSGEACLNPRPLWSTAFHAGLADDSHLVYWLTREANRPCGQGTSPHSSCQAKNFVCHNPVCVNFDNYNQVCLAYHYDVLNTWLCTEHSMYGRMADPPPLKWTCDRSRYGDGICDCGCGEDDTPLDCSRHAGCKEPGCSAFGCDVCTDPAKCESCQSNNDCMLVCINGLCNNRSSTLGACDEIADCVDNNSCVGGTCRRNNGQPCDANNLCLNTCRGPTCVDKSPLNGPCDSSDSADCQANLTCTGTTCLLSNGQSCTQDSTCSSGHCECTGPTCSARVCAAADCDCKYGNAGACSTVLNTPTDDPQDCDGTNSCYAGACLKDLNQACGADAECGSGHCECTDATCSSRVCAAADCDCGYGANGTCTGVLNNGVDDQGDCSGGYSCYSGACADDDECAMGTPCGAFATCSNTEGSYTCACTSGRGNCDGNWANGCENTLNSPGNCGACGASPPEVCDYADNDCDGGVDESAGCVRTLVTNTAVPWGRYLDTYDDFRFGPSYICSHLFGWAGGTGGGNCNGRSGFQCGCQQCWDPYLQWHSCNCSTCYNPQVAGRTNGNWFDRGYGAGGGQGWCAGNAYVYSVDCYIP